MKARQAEQKTTEDTYNKKIRENNTRVQGMSQEIAALKNEISERNNTIHDKVT